MAARGVGAARGESMAHWLHHTRRKRCGLRFHVRATPGTRPNDFNTAFATMAQQHPDAVSVLTDALITQYQRKIVDFAINERLPSVFPSKDPVQLGGLLSYGRHYWEMMRRAASQVDKILRGAQPVDLPMKQPTTFELVINLNT